jgi:hypothetical protein
MQKTASSSFSTTHTTLGGMNLEVSLKGTVNIPIVGKVEWGATPSGHWETQTANTNDESSSTQQTLTWSQQSTQTNDLIAPQHAKHCVASVFEGSYNGGYTTTIQMVVAGQTFTYQQHGTYNGVSWSSVNSQCSDLPLSSVPTGSKVENGIPVSHAGQPAAPAPPAPHVTPGGTILKRAIEFSA